MAKVIPPDYNLLIDTDEFIQLMTFYDLEDAEKQYVKEVSNSKTNKVKLSINNGKKELIASFTRKRKREVYEYDKRESYDREYE